MSEIKMGGFESNLNHFFRYMYGGLILCLVIRLVLPEQSKELYHALGGNELQNNILVIVLLIAIGIGFYVFYKVIVSELIIDNIHFKIPKLLLGHKDDYCTFKFLGDLGVEEENQLTAFRLIRDKTFKSSVRETFHLRHSETHVLYLTSTACFIGLFVWLLAFCLNFSHSTNNTFFIILIIIGIISFLSGLYSDKRICEDECSYSKLNKTAIQKTLEEAKFIKHETSHCCLNE